MKQNKYGVVLAPTDVNKWICDSSELEPLGNAVMAGFDKTQVAAVSFVYIPAEQGYCGEIMSEPLLCNVTSGNDVATGKLGFLHAIYGNDALSGNNAADYIGCRFFKTKLSLNEKNGRQGKDDGYDLQRRSYMDVAASGVFAEGVNELPCADKGDIARVLDALAQGKRVCVKSDKQDKTDAVIKTALSLLPRRLSNSIGFNTAATTDNAAVSSMIVGVNYLRNPIPEDAVLVTVGSNSGYRSANLLTKMLLNPKMGNNVEEIERIALTAGAEGFSGRMAAYTNAAAVVMLAEFVASQSEYANTGRDYSQIGMWQSIYLSYRPTMEASANGVVIGVKEEAERFFAECARLSLLDGWTAIPADVRNSLLQNFATQALSISWAADLALREVSEAVKRIEEEKLTGYLNILLDFAAGDDNIKVFANKIVALLLTIETEIVVKFFSDYCERYGKENRFKTLLAIASSVGLFTRVPDMEDYVNAKPIQNALLSGGNLRAKYKSMAPALWLIEKAYSEIKSIDELAEWSELYNDLRSKRDKPGLDPQKKKSYGDDAAALLNAFENAISEFRLSPNMPKVDESNYSAIDSALKTFNVSNAPLEEAIRVIKNRKESVATIYGKRQRFIARQYALLTPAEKSRYSLPPDADALFARNEQKDGGGARDYAGDIEKVLAHRKFKAIKSFSMKTGVLMLLAFVIAIALPSAIAFALHLFDLPWALILPKTVIPFNTAIYYIPILLSGFACIIAYIAPAYSSKIRFKKSVTVSGLLVVLPYLIFAAICIIFYII